METMAQLALRLEGMTLYTQIRSLPPVAALLSLWKETQKPQPDFSTALEQYSAFCSQLFAQEESGSFPDYLFDRVLQDENIFTLSCARGQFDSLPSLLKQAAAYDLDACWQLSRLQPGEVKELLSQTFPAQKELFGALAEFCPEHCRYQPLERWGEHLASFADHHAKNGVGVYCKYYAFALEEGKIVPVKQFHAAPLSALKKYEAQKQKLLDNTLSFLHGQHAHHVLLYGDRGTGKSTSVRALLHDYHQMGLRMIQISKEDIGSLAGVLRTIRPLPLKFILFIDDLTFEESDANFNTLKAVLEGSLSGMPDNALIYATTNRRHLIKETFTSREGSEIHASDTRDEAASLSDRFGLVLTYMKPTPQEYADIVLALAADRGIQLDEETIRQGANRFATRKGSRSGRVARQYVDQLESRLAMGLDAE